MIKIQSERRILYSGATEEVYREFVELVKKYQEDLFVAGPGFNAGRYGLGCGAATAAVTEQVKIPAVTALYAENSGTDLYKDRAHILQTENNAAKMREAMKSVAEFVDRLIKNDFIGDGRKEGYHGSGTDFQTAEEISRGSEIAISNGCLKDVAAIFGLHIGNILGKEIPTGTLIFPRACCMASFDKFIICVKGQSCHGSTLEKGVDPVNIAAHLLIALQTIQTKEISGTASSVITVGKITGGTQYNVIPDQVVLEGTIRALDETVRQYIARRIKELAVAISAMFGGSCECEIIWGAPR